MIRQLTSGRFESTMGLVIFVNIALVIWETNYQAVVIISVVLIIISSSTTTTTNNNNVNTNTNTDNDVVTMTRTSTSTSTSTVTARRPAGRSGATTWLTAPFRPIMLYDSML